MSEQDKIKLLIKLLKIYQKRPNHLAKYLIDNMAFDELFLKLLSESEKFHDMEESLPVFKTFEEMNDYFNLFDDSYKKKKPLKKVLEDLTIKLEECIKSEKYEEAVRIRDYITKIKTQK